MRKCDFNKVALITLLHGCFSVNLLHFFKTLFLENKSGWLLLWFKRAYGNLLDYHHNFVRINY